MLACAHFQDNARFKRLIGINVILSTMNAVDNDAEFFLLRIQYSIIFTIM